MKEKKNTAASVAPAATLIQHHVTKSGFASRKATTKAKQVSLTDLHLHKFQQVEGESALSKDRHALLVTFADLINTPFRTVERTIEGKATTLIQVSSSWIKQHNVDDILVAFRQYCDHGHLVTASIKAGFDSTFKRPAFTYTCKCGWSHTISYRMQKELTDKHCPECGTSAAEMMVTSN